MYNRIIIVGNLTRDVELKYLPSGNALAILGVASNRRYTKQDGTKGDETCFVDVKLFGRTAEVANQYLHKGSKILIEGRLVYETWNDQNGQKRSKHYIVADTMQMLDSKSQDSSVGSSYGGAYGGNAVNEGSGGAYDLQDSHSYQQSQPSTPQRPQISSSQHKQSAQNTPQPQIPSIDIDDDEIPF